MNQNNPSFIVGNLICTILLNIGWHGAVGKASSDLISVSHDF